ncbi:50S ribosomal protein L11 methyltransferase [Neoasaia chiangmaiensis NBRC 101099]|nr:50S ribosomal protein L11 methyltransferase [Neoasaia chiangmaiensis NBRC 101099]GEN15856.1 nicotinamide N-methylase [Neoasaia chiangmaiensis]
MMTDPADFVTGSTIIERPPLTPEIRVHLATEITPIWQATEDHLARVGVEPPFWAFAWPGSQVLARYVLDHPETVHGRRVLDFACGNGLAGIACAIAGAAHVCANDIDSLALVATRLNAALNDVDIETRPGDIVGLQPDYDLLICGDVCYNQPMADLLLPWLRRCAASCDVWMADPGRPYAPRTGVAPLMTVDVPTTRELEDGTSRTTTLYRLMPNA